MPIFKKPQAVKNSLTTLYVRKEAKAYIQGIADENDMQFIDVVDSMIFFAKQGETIFSETKDVVEDLLKVAKTSPKFNIKLDRKAKAFLESMTVAEK